MTLTLYYYKRTLKTFEKTNVKLQLCSFQFSARNLDLQEAQLLQRGRAMLRVTEYFTKSLTKGHSI